MKKFWFRTGCTLLAALMLTASLASCKKKNNDPDEGTQKTTVATSEGERVPIFRTWIITTTIS